MTDPNPQPPIPAPTPMPPGQALDLAINILREKAEADALLVKMIELHPGDNPDRHALHRYRRYLKAINCLQKIKQDLERSKHADRAQTAASH